MSTIADQEVDEIAVKIISEVEKTKSKDLAESDEVIRILH